MSNSNIFGSSFSTPEASNTWSDRTRIAYCLLFESCLARAQGDLEIIPRETAAEIEAFCKNVNNVDFKELKQDVEATGNQIVGLIRLIARRLKKNLQQSGLKEWVNYGATTQDVMDTATILQLQDTFDHILTSLLKIVAALREKIGKYVATPMATRSDLQPRYPTTLGFKLARLLATFRRHIQRLGEIRSRVIVLQFGGQGGALASLPAGQALACQEALSRLIGLPVPEIAWHTERDRICEVGGFCALVTGTCAKFATDVRLLMQTEVGEILESTQNQDGSSPTQKSSMSCAYITGMAATVRSHSSVLYEAMVADHERSAGPFNIETIVLPDMCKLTCATLEYTASLASNLEAHPEAMRENLGVMQPFVGPKAVTTALVDKIGKHAKNRAKKLQKGRDEKVPLLELLCTDKVATKELGEKRLKRLCDPSNYLGLSVQMANRIRGPR